MSVKRSAQSFKILCIILVILPFLSGCWDRLEIEERATILAIGIDKIELEEKDEEDVTHLTNDPAKEMYGDYRITVQLAIPGRLPLGPGAGGQGGGGSGGGDPTWVLEAKGHTLDDAMSVLQQEVEFRLFLGHLRVIVVSEEVAREGIKEISDFLRRNSDVRRAAWLIVSKEEASKYISAQPELERVPAIYMMSTMDEAVRLGKFPNDFIGLFWSTLSSKGQDAYLPYVELEKEQNIKISGLAYFNEDKMAGVTTPLQIGHFMAAMEMNPGGYKALKTLPNEQGTFMMESVSRTSIMRVDIKNGKPHATVDIHIEADISEASGDFNIDNSKTIKKLEKIMPEEAKKGLDDLFSTTQEAKSDIFGFGEYVRAKHPNYWDKEVKTREKWKELYKDMPVDVSITYSIRRVGMKAR